MIWMTMRKRCTNPKARGYKYYGGRGINVCVRWNDYAAFLSDMGEATTGKSIDRIDNDGDYEPSNCRWATGIEQARNSRKELTFNGETMCVSAWEKRLNLSQGALWHRIKKGWSLSKALTTRKLP